MFKKLVYTKGQKIHAVRRLELRHVLRYLAPIKGEKILDVGCGKGYLCSILHSKGCVCSGFDPSNRDVEIASRYQSKDINFSVSFAEKIPFKDSFFDKVVSVCVLEHVDNDCKALSEINRVLKRGGIFVASLDSLSSSYYSEKYKKFYSKEFKVNRFYDISKVMQLFYKSGFKIISYRYLISGFLSSFLVEIFSYLHFRSFFILLFPVIYPIFYLQDKFFNNPNVGFILIVKAVKK